MKIVLSGALFALLLFRAEPIAAAQEVYPQGCPDTVMLLTLLNSGKVSEVLKELSDFNRYIQIITKPCNILVHKLYGISYLNQDPDLAKLYWRAMLYLSPQAEIFDLNILSYRVQSEFDKVKADMTKDDLLKNAYSGNYIPPVYPTPRDSPRIDSWKKLYHEQRVFAFSNDFSYSKTKLKDTLQAFVKRGQSVDPAFMILEADLRTRRSSRSGEAVFEASTLIQNGLEVLKQRGSVLADGAALEDWARRLKARFAVAGDSR